MEQLTNTNSKGEIITPLFTVDKEYFKNEFILDKNKFTNYYDNYSKDFNWKRHNYTSYHLFNEYFNDSVMCWGNKDCLSSNITFNYFEFTLKIQEYLNIKDFVNSDDILFKKQIQDRINILKGIYTENMLADEFPKLHNIYIVGNRPNGQNNYYYNCGLRYIVSRYVIEQAAYFQCALNNIDKIKDIYINYSITKNAVKDNIDRNKYKLYAAHRVFDTLVCYPYIANVPNSLALLENYFNDKSTNINTSITLENNSQLSYIKLLSDYSKYINGGTINTWEIAPQGHDKTKVFHEPTNFNQMSDEEFNRLVKLNKEKYDFYENLPYLARARGKYMNTGYYAFFLPNGEQLLDKLCYPDDKFITSHYGNSIFNLNIYNFELLSHIDKTTLRQHNLCPNTTHQGNWKERATNMINKSLATPNTIDQTKALIKRIQI